MIFLTWTESGFLLNIAISYLRGDRAGANGKDEAITGVGTHLSVIETAGIQPVTVITSAQIQPSPFPRMVVFLPLYGVCRKNSF